MVIDNKDVDVLIDKKNEVMTPKQCGMSVSVSN